MTPSDWIAAVALMTTVLGALATAYINLRVRVARLEEKISLWSEGLKELKQDLKEIIQD